MEIKRKVLLSCLEKVMPVISSKSAPDCQLLNFYGNRLQATNGRIVVDTVLPEGLKIDLKVQAEPLFLLLKKLKAKNIKFEIKEGNLYVMTKKTEGIFTAYEPTPAKVPEFGDDISVDKKDFIEGLKFCKLGISKDETAGPLCGIKVQDSSLFSCDRYRILNWKLSGSIGFECCAPAKLADILDSFRDEVEKLTFSSKGDFGGCFGISLKDGTTIWAATIEGNYKDLSGFFPEGTAEVITLEDGFSDVLDRHLAFLKDVTGDDKEVLFTVGAEEAETVSQKFIAAGEKDRTLLEVVNLKSPRTGKQFSFGVNPILLKDIIGLSLEFQYFKELSVALFSSDKFRYLVKARS